MNKFIDYLNSLNNANGNNENAIAENQVNDTSHYYKRVSVKSAIAQEIIRVVEEKKPIVFFLTGHAGDGKTSILLQVIDHFIDLDSMELSRYGILDIGSGNRLHYVKDISENAKDEQLSQISEAIDLAKMGTSSIIISNTGQLLDLFAKNNIKESDALNIIDNAQGYEGTLNGVDIRVINIALCDNTNFISEFVGNIVADDLWEDCNNCQYNHSCEMFCNKQLITKYKENVIKFIENYYKWNIEDNNRSTIRQMVAHITYAITGNSNCRTIMKNNRFDERYFHNNFANLFFGYRNSKSGLAIDNKARNIKGIRDIQSYKLEERKMEVEYELFVKENFSLIADEIRPYVKFMWSNYQLSENGSGTDEVNAIKRVYMFFNIKNKVEREQMYTELYSKTFISYLNFQNEESTRAYLNKIQKIVFSALFKLFTGITDNDSSKLYLTIKQNSEKMQNVQIVQGYLYREDIKVLQSIKTNISTGKTYKELNIKFKDSEQFCISYKMLNFLDEIYDGIVQTEIDPILSQGIDNIKARFRLSMQPISNDILTLLVYNGQKVALTKMELCNDKITIID